MPKTSLKSLASFVGLCIFCLSIGVGSSVVAQNAPDAKIQVHAKDVMHDVSRYMAGACIEDVNHEIYGGIYSQMVYGESFQEPKPAMPFAIHGFQTFEGQWVAKDGQVAAPAGNGPKLISDAKEFSTGEVGVDVFFAEEKEGNAGLIVKVTAPGNGADCFTGYEVALDPKNKTLVLGRHQQNFEPLRRVPCDVPIGQWIPLTVKLVEKTLEISVDGKSLLTYDDGDRALAAGRVGLRTWQREAKFRNLWIQTAGQKQSLALEPVVVPSQPEVSRMWQPVQQGTAKGDYALESEKPFIGAQSQRMTFSEGDGAIGVENRGLNHWGMAYQAGKPYEGYLWVKSEKPVELFAALENADGSQVYAETSLAVAPGDWQRLNFTLTPNQKDVAGRFSLKLKKPGSILLGHAFLQPGEWGRFKGLPVRKDVAEGLIEQGVTVLRYGGCMANAPEYRWKKMIGPRDRRPPYQGFWFPQSSNGWGIIDFINFCEAAGFLCVPDLNSFETPQDMADFVEYLNGPADSEWGKRRAADGHPEPYRLKHVQIGNEECVSEDYWKRFKPIAEAMWAKDPEIILVVGDFIYSQPIVDPFKFTGAPNITSLAAQKKILDLAKEHNREVWFDVHIGTAHPRDWQGLCGVPSFIDALGKICPGAKYKVVIFEYNADVHHLGRALGNARATNELIRLGSVPIACSANCLQPDKQNENGWNQGLLFLDPSRVWPQPPYFVTQMVSRNYLEKCVRVESQSPGNALDVTAVASKDGKILQLRVVNLEGKPLTAAIQLDGFTPTQDTAQVTTLSGNLNDVNGPEKPWKIEPKQSSWRHQWSQGNASYTFPPYSFSIIRCE
jgi:hypothetical protein